MAGNVLLNALSIINGCLVQNYSNSELAIIDEEIRNVAGGKFQIPESNDGNYSYKEVQEILATINEKESSRKSKGVYYTPLDLVQFILFNSAKLAYGKVGPDNLAGLDLSAIPIQSFCYDKTVYDPTCGAGAFLLAALQMKFDLLDSCHTEMTCKDIRAVVSTIRGNDVNRDSIAIAKLRLLLCVLQRYGVSKIKGLSRTMAACFTSYDFVSAEPDATEKYDIIVGNPPYVEDSKSDSAPATKYGNIYANVLRNAALHLEKDGVMGFVVPLSYVSTPRMKKIRNDLFDREAEQYILSYSDRPDCLFPAVHQKLCVLLGKNTGTEKTIYTGNYRYWYKEEREKLFGTVEVVKNVFAQDNFIPKLGTRMDCEIYKKVIRPKTELLKLFGENGVPVYLNMRATFWIKAFLSAHNGAEYREFKCQSQAYANFCMCLLNSSLFWWFWICVSDCWHITKKELMGFRVPTIDDFGTVNRLATALEQRLEDTKVYVGTKQTDYEYKHKECVAVIHEIDDYINAVYGLTEEEGNYIKNFSYRYRIGGGAENVCN